MTAKKITTGTYLLVYVALLILLGLTVFVAEIDLGRIMLLVTLAIAVMKAGMVVIYFMHLRTSEPFIRLVAVAGLLWLTLLIGLTMCDVANRREVKERNTPVSQVQAAQVQAGAEDRQPSVGDSVLPLIRNGSQNRT